jgi:AraC-like DNA-binding protein
MDNRDLPQSEFNRELKLKGFVAFAIGHDDSIVRTYNRKIFFKICLVSGKNRISYADKGIEVDGTTLFFGNPLIPYSWEIVSERQTGYCCLFREDFLRGHDRSDSLQGSPLFRIGGTPIFHVSPQQRENLAEIYKKMIVEQDSAYTFKEDLIRNYINLLIHEALKMEPSEKFFKHKNASSRITALFLELLERQFPIESLEAPLQLRSAQDYANRLSIHVNHLNRALKEITGKPTTVHITERIISEAKALLHHTDWTISQVASSLGFEYPTYFNNYFKKYTGTTPSALRLQAV